MVVTQNIESSVSLNQGSQRPAAACNGVAAGRRILGVPSRRPQDDRQALRRFVRRVRNMVTAADADFVASACNTTLTVTFAGFGTCAGAVYAPKALIVPVDAVPPTTPFTSQLTAVFVVPVTVSLNGVI